MTFFTAGVILGQPSESDTFWRLTPHHSKAACATPAAETAIAARKAVWRLSSPSRAAVIRNMLSKVGAPAERMNRPEELSTPESKAASAIQAR